MTGRLRRVDGRSGDKPGRLFVDVRHGQSAGSRSADSTRIGFAAPGCLRSQRLLAALGETFDCREPTAFSIGADDELAGGSNEFGQSAQDEGDTISAGEQQRRQANSLRDVFTGVVVTGTSSGKVVTHWPPAWQPCVALATGSSVNCPVRASTIARADCYLLRRERAAAVREESRRRGKFRRTSAAARANRRNAAAWAEVCAIAATQIARARFAVRQLLVAVGSVGRLLRSARADTGAAM